MLVGGGGLNGNTVIKVVPLFLCHTLLPPHPIKHKTVHNNVLLFSEHAACFTLCESTALKGHIYEIDCNYVVYRRNLSTQGAPAAGLN